MPEIAAIPEIAGEAGAGAGGAGGGLGGMLKDFNDMPGAGVAGSMFGKVVHAVTGAIGTHGPEERVNEGPVGTIA
jgi:hypothetical protein